MAKKLTKSKARKILHDKEVHGHPLTEQQRKFFGAIAGGAKPYKAESGGWLDKFDMPQAQNGIEGTMGGLTDVGFNYNGAWGGPSMQMGGVLPGAVGFTYARTQSPAPANGPYAKKTKASAQNGQEMKYYQEGLDFKPKTISQNGSAITTDINDYRRWQDSVRNYIRGQKDLAKARTDVKKNINTFSLMSGSGLVGAFSNLIQGDIQGKRRFLPEYKEQSLPRQYWGPEEKYPQVPKDVIVVGDPAFDTSKRIKGLTEALSQNKNLTGTNFYPYSGIVEIYHPPVRRSLKYQPPVKKKPISATSKKEDVLPVKKLEKPIPIPREAIDLGYELPVPGAPRPIETSQFENKPTKYTFTYPTGKYNEQKTMYFPSKAALKSFVGSIRDASYQEGADYATATGTLQDGGDIPVDPMGYWNPENVGNPVIIPSNIITMEGVDQPLIGISDTGDVQYMEPGEDYEFDGEYVTEYPVAQKGKTIPAPTTADSARLYNAQMALNKFYENEMKAGRLKKESQYNLFDRNPFSNNLKEENLSFYRGQIERRNKKGSGLYDEEYKKYFNLSPEQVKQLEYRGLAQTKGASEYQQYYRDIVTPQQNLGSPLALIDSRITPQKVIFYEPTGKTESYPGGFVEVYDYDPLAIKPYHMRTPQEKIEWEKKYGKKETPKAKPVTPQKDKKIITGSKKEFDKYNNESPLILDKDGIYRNDMGIAFRFEKPTPPPAKKKVVTPETVRQTIPPAAIPSSTSSVKSVSEKVGKLDMFGKKDVELLVDNFGNYEWFRKDDDIGDLKPIRRATREEIEYSKKQKQRNGGVNKADEYPIEKLDQLLNFTNYNKPTKGGWLDKYN